MFSRKSFGMSKISKIVRPVLAALSVYELTLDLIMKPHSHEINDEAKKQTMHYRINVYSYIIVS